MNMPPEEPADDQATDATDRPEPRPDLAELRCRAGYSQQGLAERLDVSVSTIRGWELKAEQDMVGEEGMTGLHYHADSHDVVAGFAETFARIRADSLPQFESMNLIRATREDFKR